MSLLDPETLNGSKLRADFCVVGGGPAGIAVASTLANAGHEVIVVEAGAGYYDRHDLRNMPRAVAGHLRGAQAAARGRNRGNPYFPLRMSRVRGIGGSTQALKAHGLRSRPLDAIDFEPRLNAGWPISHDEFAIFLDEAANLCGIPGSSISWDELNSQPVSDIAPELTTIGFRHGPRDSFGLLGLEGLRNSRQRWITSATVTGFAVDATSHITHVQVNTRGGSSFAVDAPNVVLAGGGIDNARLMLNSSTLLETMGQSSDQVGKNFMEHLHYMAGHLVPKDADARREIQRRFETRADQEPWLTVADSTVRAEGLARSAFTAIPIYSGSMEPGVSAFGRSLRAVPFGPFDRALWKQEIRAMIRSAARIPGAFVEQLNSTVEREMFALAAMSEQTANDASRITLSDRRDRYGLRLPVLEWRLNGTDIESAHRAIDLLGADLAASGLGEFIPSRPELDGRSPVVTGGWHHMGTTMMSADASRGVVDADCRVHGLQNLYVAGSSVFPTGGFANPTLSLVALSIRLGHHLSAQAS